MKKLLSLMCSFLMIVTLCGCSSTQDQQEEVTLQFAAAASLENTFEDKLIPEFEKENPQMQASLRYLAEEVTHWLSLSVLLTVHTSLLRNSAILILRLARWCLLHWLSMYWML